MMFNAVRPLLIEYYLRIAHVLAAHRVQLSAVSDQLKKVWKGEDRLVDIQ